MSKRQKEEENIQEYINKKYNTMRKNFLIGGIIFSIIFCLIFQWHTFADFIGLTGIVCISILLLCKYDKAESVSAWRDEYLKLHYPRNKPTDKDFVGNCPHCKTRFRYPYAATKIPASSEATVSPNQSETGHPPIIITCPSCLQKLRVPGDKAVIVHCPRCNHSFRHP